MIRTNLRCAGWKRDCTTLTIFDQRRNKTLLDVVAEQGWTLVVRRRPGEVDARCPTCARAEQEDRQKEADLAAQVAAAQTTYANDHPQGDSTGGDQ